MQLFMPLYTVQLSCPEVKITNAQLMAMTMILGLRTGCLIRSGQLSVSGGGSVF